MPKRGKIKGGSRSPRAGAAGGDPPKPKVYVTAEAKAMVRQSLIVDRNLLVLKGKQFDKFMARFVKQKQSGSCLWFVGSILTDCF